MNKTILALGIAMLTNMAAFAEWEGDGFYRFTNYDSGRTAFLADCHASIDVGSSKVDMTAIELWRDQEKPLSDPSSVLYITGVGSQYDIAAQGCSVHSMIGEYLNLKYNSQYKAYLAYGKSSGLVKYLGDPDPYKTPMSYMSDTADGDLRYWYLKPIKMDGNNYYGLKPCVEVGGKYYSDTFGSFAYELGKDMEACYVISIDKERGLAVYAIQQDAKLAGASPVFVKCAGAQPSDNKVSLMAKGGTAPKGNLLKGNYFDSKRYNHNSYTTYDKATMRVLGVTDAGELGYVTADYEVIPRNISYLVVPAGAPSQLKLVTEEEYAEIVAGISSAVADAGISVKGRELLNQQGNKLSVYSILGATVYQGNNTNITLHPGVYVVRTATSATKIIIK